MGGGGGIQNGLIDGLQWLQIRQWSKLIHYLFSGYPEKRKLAMDSEKCAIGYSRSQRILQRMKISHKWKL